MTWQKRLFWHKVLQCGLIAQGVDISCWHLQRYPSGRQSVWWAANPMWQTSLAACPVQQCVQISRGRCDFSLLAFPVLPGVKQIYMYTIYTPFFSHSSNSPDPYCTTSRQKRLCYLSLSLIVKAKSRPNSLGHPCCKWCHVVVLWSVEKSVDEKWKKKKVIFFSLFSIPHDVSVVYTFETFNVYVFYTSTDIFLVLFYNGKKLKVVKTKKNRCAVHLSLQTASMLPC